MGRFGLDGSTEKAVRMLQAMGKPEKNPDEALPRTLIKHCEGIAFITIVKAGLFFLGGNAGSGCIIVKVPDPDSPKGWRWSGPSAIKVGGLGGGFIFGGEKIDSIVVLNTKSAVRSFMGEGSVTFGGNLSIAAGPYGRDMGGNVGLSNTKEIVAAYSYSHAKGAYIGATLEGAFLVARTDENKAQYKTDKATPDKVLTGEIPVPENLKCLAEELNLFLAREGYYKDLGPSQSSAASATGRSLVRQSVSGNEVSNAHTNTTTNAATAATAASADANANANATAASGYGGHKAGLELRDGWETATTPQGEVYYYHTTTNQTQWEPPLKPVQSAKQTMGSPPPPPRPPASRPPPPSLPPRIPKLPTAQALYPYTAAEADEVSLKAGDRVQLEDTQDNAWWKVKVLSTGKIGLAPANYLQRD